MAELADGQQSTKTDKELAQTMAEAGGGEGKPGAPVKECDKVRTVYVRKVKGPARAKVGDTVKYEAYEFYIKEEGKTVGPEELCAAEKAKVKWTVIVDGKRHDSEQTGDTLEFEVPEEMGGTKLNEKKMHVHPYMNAPASSIKVETLVDDGKIIIVIDPGHGDIFKKYLDPGAVGYAADGKTILAKEKDLALAVSNDLKAALLKLELVTEVYLTRTGDLKDKVRPRLKWRTDIAHAKGADYLISLHMDAASPSANGHTVFYKDGNAESKKLAQAITKVYTLTKRRGEGAKTKSLYVTRKFRGIAGVLIELGFITNAGDRTIVSTKGAAIAAEIAKGVNDYLEAMLGPGE